MNTNEHESGTPADEIIQRVIGAAYEVANILGAGFLEKVYERALLRELGLRGISAAAQIPCPFPIRVTLLAPTLPIFWLSGSLSSS